MPPIARRTSVLDSSSTLVGGEGDPGDELYCPDRPVCSEPDSPVERASIETSPSRVLLCHGPKDTAVGPMLGAVGFNHYWIETPAKQAGLGPPTYEASRGLLGLGGEVIVGNEMGRRDSIPGSICRPVDEVDEACVDRELALGKDLGRWTPLNNCYTFALDVLEHCSNKTPVDTSAKSYSESPDRHDAMYVPSAEGAGRE